MNLKSLFGMGGEARQVMTLAESSGVRPPASPKPPQNVVENSKTTPVLERLLGDPRIVPLRDSVAKAVAVYYGAIPGVEWAVTDSTVKLKSLHQELSECNNHEEREGILQEIAMASDPASDQSLKISAFRQAAAAFVPVQKVMAELVATAEMVVGQFAAEARDAEAAFFAEWGLLHERTGVSRRLKTLAAEIEHVKGALAPVAPNLTSSNIPTPHTHPVFQFFQIEKLPVVAVEPVNESKRMRELRQSTESNREENRSLSLNT